MTPWLTAAELSGLPGMPASEFRTRALLKQLGTPSRPREGQRGGGGREFDTADLPLATRRALLQRSDATPSEQLPAVATQTLPATQPVASVSTAQPPTRQQSQCADARSMLVRHLINGAEALGGMVSAVQRLSEDLAAGTAAADIMDVAACANQRARISAGVTISKRTLLRWVGQYRKAGWAGLLPAAAQASTAAELGADVQAVLQAFAKATGAARNLTHCAMDVNCELGRPYDDWKRLYAQARRALPKLDKTALIKARHRGAERAAKLPFKRRDTSVLAPNDVWLVDGHTFKAKVRHPVHGQPFAPEVTVAIDAATRKVVGWSASLSESTIAVGDCIRHAVGLHGVPAIVYSDNGSGERAKVFDCPVAGLFARLGSEHRTGLPGHPQGHGLIERSWRTHMIRCARQFGSYQGGDVDSRTLRDVTLELAREKTAIKRAAASGEVVKLSGKVPAWDHFLQALQQSFDAYNHQHRHRGLPKLADGPAAGKHATPQEAWELMATPDELVMLDAPTLRHLFMPAVQRKAERGEVRWLSATYFNSALMDVDQEPVLVHYDIHDASRVWVWTLEGRFVCEAQAGANRMGYFPAPVIERAREKRVMGMVKRRQAQIDTALAELQPALDAPQSNPNTLDLADLQRLSQGRELLPVERTDTPTSAALPAGQRPAFFDSAADRYEWLMRHREQWLADDTQWLRDYAGTQDYEDLRDYFASRGIAWPEGDAAFKHAG